MNKREPYRPARLFAVEPERSAAERKDNFGASKQETSGPLPQWPIAPSRPDRAASRRRKREVIIRGKRALRAMQGCQKRRSTALRIADSRAPRRRAGPPRYLCSGDRTPRGAVAAPAAAVALGLGAEAHVRLRITGLLRSVELERVEQGGRDSKSESAPPPSSRARN
jgi:hypothetical protein